MNLQTIQMDRAPARAAFLEYRHSVRELRGRELETYDERRAAMLADQRETDEAIMRGYRLLSLGRQIIEIGPTIAAGGVDELHRPKLAIARADRQNVHLQVQRNGAVSFGQISQRSDHRNPRTKIRTELPAGTLPGWTGGDWSVWATSKVPLIPPRFRPRELDHYHILFEADWKRVPVDPALLRSLGGGLFAVVAVWDLTPIERAVLELRG